MDINLLIYFVTVADTMHLRNAAALLGVSPSALSKSIKDLEHQLGFKLLQRAGRGFAITARGAEFYRQCQPLLYEARRLRSVLAGDSRASDTPVRVGSFEVFTTYLLNFIINEKLQAERIVAYELTPGKIENALLANEIDLGLSYVPVPHQQLDFQKIATFEMG